MKNHRELLLIFGPPAAGKSTFVQALTEGLESDTHKVEGLDEMRPSFTYMVWRGDRYDPHNHVLELGAPDNGTGFRGSDRLNMRVVGRVRPWVLNRRPRLLMVEGARLAHPKVADWFRAAGYDVVGVHLSVPLEESLRRQQERFEENREAWVATIHSRKDPDRLPKESWVKGRYTQCRKLCAHLGDDCLELPGTLRPARLVEEAAAFSQVASTLYHMRRP